MPVGQPSPLQLKSYQESDARINIWEGAVRSGKTYISLWRFITELFTGPKGEYVLITRTYDAFKRNILPLLEHMIGVREVNWQSGHRIMNIGGNRVHVVGADDERAEAKIRGPTFAGAYVDEITIIPESVFKMLISRCAMGGAKIFGTTNPDSPYHWLKQEYLDNNDDVKSWQFRLEDNPELTQDEKDYLSRQYTGLWHQRFIEGRWVQAEGAVYEFFTEERCCIDHPPSYTAKYIIGIDYGTTNPCTFVLVGIDFNRFPNYWVESEYYFDSKRAQRQKTDSEYGDDLIRFIGNKPIEAIYLDPSAVSFRTELRKVGITNIFEANNEVLDGINFLRNLLWNGSLKVCKGCKNLIQEFQSYCWDAKASQRGEDKPKKENDHCLTGDTLVWTTKGKIPIKDLEDSTGIAQCWDINKNTFTLSSFQDVKKTREKQNIFKLTLENGHSVRATADHKVWTKRGYVEIQNLLKEDEVLCYD